MTDPGTDEDRPGSESNSGDERGLVGDGGESRLVLRRTDAGVQVVVDLHGVDGAGVGTEVVIGEDSLVLSVGDGLAWWVVVEEGPTSITDVSLQNDVFSVQVSVE